MLNGGKQRESAKCIVIEYDVKCEQRKRNVKCYVHLHIRISIRIHIHVERNIVFKCMFTSVFYVRIRIISKSFRFT